MNLLEKIGIVRACRIPALALCALFALSHMSSAQEPFRTDANPDKKLPWFLPQPGEFPPEGSAHYFRGELIHVDHVNRRGTLRVDRTDAQNRSHWDLPVDFELLPYGSLRYHGAPAELRDIPLGTHLHGWFYVKDPGSQGTKTVFYNRASIEADFTRAFRLQDDFSYYAGREQAWRVDAVNLDEKTLAVTGISTADGAADEKPSTFEILPATRVWQGRQIATLRDIAPGQIVQVNLTWATMYGPGRCADIWLDEESRTLASAQQLEIHRQYQKERGLAGWIDEVDNQKRILKVTLFEGFDPALLEDFTDDTTITAVVAEPSLRSYDQVNDRKSGPLLARTNVEKQPGSSGVQITFEPSLLLEGFRPGRIIRVFPSGWPVISIPLEERLWPARD